MDQANIGVTNLCITYLFPIRIVTFGLHQLVAIIDVRLVCYEEHVGL